MTRAAHLMGLAIMGMLLAMPAARADGDRVRDCMSPSEARDVLIAQKFLAPFRALSEAARAAQGEAVGVQLCHHGDDFVYDVTVLRRDGRVMHALVNARTGLPVPPARPGR